MPTRRDVNSHKYGEQKKRKGEPGSYASCLKGGKKQVFPTGKGSGQEIDMGYVRVPRDIKRVKPKFLGPLNKRQTFTMATGIGLGGLTYFLAKPCMGSSEAVFVLMAVMTPILFAGLFEKDGRYLEDILRDFVTVKFLRPGIRIYRSENLYAYLQDKIYEREVLSENDDGKKPFIGRAKEKISKLF